MRRAFRSAAAGQWPASEATGSVVLDYDSRHRRRLRLECEDGAVLLDLPETAVLADGDGLELDGGGWIAVRAAPEELAEIRCADAELLHRAAWHLGNRHCPADIGPGRIRVRRDHVIEHMLRGLGCDPIPVRATFNPERGAYHAHDDMREKD